MPIDQAILFRGSERLLVCLFAGGCLILGWDLFRRGVDLAQRADFKGSGFTIRLERVGPGIFFALFGAATLAVSLRSPLSFPMAASSEAEKSNAGSGKRAIRGGSFEFLGGDRDYRLRVAQSINSLLPLQRSAAVTPLEKRALAELERLRDGYVTVEFGADKLKVYRNSIDRFAINSANVSQADRLVIQDLQPWLEDTLALSGNDR